MALSEGRQGPVQAGDLTTCSDETYRLIRSQELDQTTDRPRGPRHTGAGALAHTRRPSRSPHTAASRAAPPGSTRTGPPRRTATTGPCPSRTCPGGPHHQEGRQCHPHAAREAAQPTTHGASCATAPGPTPKPPASPTAPSAPPHSTGNKDSSPTAQKSTTSPRTVSAAPTPPRTCASSAEAATNPEATDQHPRREASKPARHSRSAALTSTKHREPRAPNTASAASREHRERRAPSTAPNSASP